MRRECTEVTSTDACAVICVYHLCTLTVPAAAPHSIRSPLAHLHLVGHSSPPPVSEMSDDTHLEMDHVHTPLRALPERAAPKVDQHDSGSRWRRHAVRGRTFVGLLRTFAHRHRVSSALVCGLSVGEHVHAALADRCGHPRRPRHRWRRAVQTTQPQYDRHARRSTTNRPARTVRRRTHRPRTNGRRMLTHASTSVHCAVLSPQCECSDGAVPAD
jgi:hypothetical protein